MAVFAENLKHLRKLHKMNQTEVAKYLGVGQTSVANYEKGIRVPNQETLRNLALLFGTSTDYLVGMEAVIDETQSLSQETLRRLQSQFLSYVLNNDETAAIEMIVEKAKTKQLAISLIESVIVGSMYQVGQLWYEGQIDVAKEHFVTGVVRKILGRISGILEVNLRDQKETAICLTYYDELHTMGIEIISEYLRILGYRVFNLGSTAPEADLLNFIKEMGADLLAISISRTMYIDDLQQLIKRVRDHFTDKTIRIIVGGQGIVRNNQLIVPLAVDGFATDYTSLTKLVEGFREESL